MTTLIGIRAGNGNGIEGVVLASDSTMTRTNWVNQGDSAYREQTRSEAKKIYVGENGEFALCMSGFYDEPYTDFLSEVLKGKIDLRNVTKTGFFKEFANMNLARWDGRVPNNDRMSALLLATRFEKPSLYTCYPLGHVEERRWTSIGSGSEHAIQYLSGKEIIPQEIGMGQAINLAIEGLDEASRDIYTGGINLVTITEAGIEDFTSRINEAVKRAKTRVITGIRNKFA